MNFSDDEDFFERAGEDEDDLLPFEGYECYQPPVEMPPEDEVSLEPEQFQEGSEPCVSSPPSPIWEDTAFQWLGLYFPCCGKGNLPRLRFNLIQHGETYQAQT